MPGDGGRVPPSRSTSDASHVVRRLTELSVDVDDELHMVDLAAVLPFWVMFSPPGEDGGGGFGFVRVIRLIRVFRVFKLGRYSTGLQMFTGAMTGSVQPLGILVFVMGINMIIVSRSRSLWPLIVITKSGSLTSGSGLWHI